MEKSFTVVAVLIHRRVRRYHTVGEISQKPTKQKMKREKNKKSKIKDYGKYGK